MAKVYIGVYHTPILENAGCLKYPAYLKTENGVLITVYKTYYPKADEITRDWVLVDANDQTLGRMATQIATLLLGKHKPGFTPGVEMGDFVIVVNAEADQGDRQ